MLPTTLRAACAACRKIVRMASTESPRRGRAKGEASGIPSDVSELLALVRGYVQQETVAPLKGLARFVAFGIAGSTALGIGLLLVTLAGLRALQTETGGALDNNRSWVPYVVMLAWCGGIAFLAVRAIGKGDDGKDAS